MLRQCGIEVNPQFYNFTILQFIVLKIDSQGVKMIRTLGSTSRKDLRSCSEAKGKICQISMSMISSISDTPKDTD